MATMLQLQTKQDLFRLQTYGAMYLAGVEPVDIELFYRDDRASFDQLSASIARVAGEGSFNVDAIAAADTVSLIFNSISMVSSIIGIFTSGIGAAVAAAVGIIGMIVSSALREEAETACDSGDCKDAGSDDKKDRHKRALVGIHVASDAERMDNWSCRLLHYGGMAYQCEASWGYLASFTNDGMWWWGRGNAGLLDGTVIGIRGRVDDGLTAGCHTKWYSRPEAPLVGGMKEKARPNTTGSDLSREFTARQEAVTQYLEWLYRNMEFPLLSCLDSSLRTIQKGGGEAYWVCISEEAQCHETALAKYMGVEGDRFKFEGDMVPSSKYCSRVYASIRAMFQALVAECDRIGVNRARPILQPLLGDKAFRKLVSAIRKQKDNIEPWPEHEFAMEVPYKRLKAALDIVANYVLLDLQGCQESGGRHCEERMQNYLRKGPNAAQLRRDAAVAAANLAEQKRQALSSGRVAISYAPLVRQRIEELSVHPLLRSPGGLGYILKPWMLWTAAGVLGLGALTLIYLGGEKEPEQ